MDRLPEPVVAEAFALSSARGADLLVRLGAFDVWRGDLGAMRGDEPRAAVPSADAATSGYRDQALMVVRAIAMLQPDCRAALAARYGDKVDAPLPAPELVTSCERRLFEIYQSLDRDHAVLGDSHRR